MTFKNIKRVFVLIILLISCLKEIFCQYDYINDSGANNLLFLEKNEFKIGYLHSTIEDNFQIGYSPLNYISLKGEYFTHSQKGNRENERKYFYGKGYVASGVLGLYLFLEKKRKNSFKRKSNLRNKQGTLLYINSGYSRGKIENISKSFKSEFGYQKYFIDTGFSFRFHYSSINFNFKYSTINYLDGTIYGQAAEEDEIGRYLDRVLKSFNEESVYSMFEFMLQIETGIKQVKLFAGLPITFRSINKPNIPHIQDRRVFVGIVLELNKIYEVINNR